MIARSSESLVSVCRVERGLYAFRYGEAASQPWPRADLVPLKGDISFVLAPGRDRPSLVMPGQTIIVVAPAGGEFEIRVLPMAGGGTDAKFNLDLLDGGDTANQTSSSSIRPAWGDAARQLPVDDAPELQHGARYGGPLDRVTLTAHVSRRGDISVGSNRWIAGPDEILPIEGLAISTGRKDLAVRVRVQSVRNNQQWTRWHDADEFAGSRQQADPLTSIGLALTGDAALQYEIVAEVLHLGSPPSKKSGRMIEFFGIDPLVGFRFDLVPATQIPATPAERPASPLRVFRAKH